MYSQHAPRLGNAVENCRVSHCALPSVSWIEAGFDIQSCYFPQSLLRFEVVGWNDATEPARDALHEPAAVRHRRRRHSGAATFRDERQNDYVLSNFSAGHRAVLVAIISTAVHEACVVLLDLLLLSSFINHLSQQHEHIPPARAADGQSFCSLQVRLCKSCFFFSKSLPSTNTKPFRQTDFSNWSLISSREWEEIWLTNYPRTHPFRTWLAFRWC